MESDWRWNVARLGLDWRVYKYCARLLDFPTAFCAARWYDPANRWDLVVEQPPGELMTVITQIGHAVGSFPWDVRVFPD